MAAALVEEALIIPRVKDEYGQDKESEAAEEMIMETAAEAAGSSAAKAAGLSFSAAEAAGLSAEEAAGSSAAEAANSSAAEAAGWSAAEAAVGSSSAAEAAGLLSAAEAAGSFATIQDTFQRESLAHGGPAKFLQAKLNIPEERNAFEAWLEEHCPRSVQEYPKEMPESTDDKMQTFVVHVSQLGHKQEMTCKAVVDYVTSLKLAEEILKDGFVTATDPIHLGARSQPGPFALSYIKGMTRATTLLMLLYLNYKGEELPNSEKVRQSAGTITCVYFAGRDSVTEVIMNAKLAQRGALRQANNMVTWAGILRLLSKKGASPQDVMRKWNAETTGSNQIMGQKRQGVMQLLALPQPQLDLVLQIVSESTWAACPFTEDFLAGPKMRTGSSVRTATKEWQDRLRTSPEAHDLFLNHLLIRYRNLPPAARTKMRRLDLENLVHTASLLLSIKQDVRNRVALPEKALHEGLDQHMVENDPNLMAELEVLLQERPTNFSCTSVGAVRTLLATHSPSSAGVGVADSLAFEAARLETVACHLDLDNIRNDVKRYDLWKAKVEDRSAAFFHANLDHKRKVWKTARDFSEGFVKHNVVVGLISDESGSIMRKLRQLEVTGVFVGVLNWAVPALMSAASQNAQLQLLGQLLAEEKDRAIAAFLTPVFSWRLGRKGPLVPAEMAVLRQITSAGNLMLDNSFSVLFLERVDQRDERPQMYPGRLVLHNEARLESGPFASIALRYPGWTEPAQQRRTADMLVLEDLLSNELKAEEYLYHTIPLSVRYSQIGPDAWSKILAASTTGVQGSICFVDFTPDTGDFLDAFLKVVPQRPYGSRLFLLADSQDHKDFLLEKAISTVANLWLQKQWTNDLAPPSKELPVEARGLAKVMSFKPPPPPPN